MFHKFYHMYSDINNKEETNEALLLTRMSDHEDINKVSKTTVNSHEIIITNILSKYKRLSHSISIWSNQYPLKCGTVMKLGWTPTVNGVRLCVVTSNFKGKECGRCKLKSVHPSGAPYLSYPS